MRTSMTYPIRFWALILSGLLLYQFSSEALADRCKFEKDIDLTPDLSTSDILSINAIHPMILAPATSEVIFAY
jgi:hypothetical protein